MKGWEEIERKTYEFNPEFGQLKEIYLPYESEKLGLEVGSTF
jgi:hypothetical protein